MHKLNSFVSVRFSHEKCAALDAKLIETINAHADKVEKGLVKNLLVGYVVAPNPTDKLQILKLISSVLDFTQTEVDKCGLNKTHVSWLNSLKNAAIGSGHHQQDNNNGTYFLNFNI